MKHYLNWALCLAILAASGCGTSGTVGGTGGTGATTDTAGGSDTGTSTGSGDSTKNKAAIGTTTDSGTKSNVSVDKSASKEDAQASANKIGAVNNGKDLILWVASTDNDGAKVLEVHIDTTKHPLPATGIPAGDMNSGAWVQYTVAGTAATGAYSSKGTGTIDVSTCPVASGVAVVGKLNGVKVESDATAVGPKSFTLDGPFNLVYFGGGGALTCKAEEPKPDAIGTDSNGKVETGAFKPPAGSTCNANPCDDGSNATRGCCPYVPCMGTCITTCTTTMSTCAQNCGMGNPMEVPTCLMGCMDTYFKCHKSCLTSCNVSATCNTAYTKLVDCENANIDVCGGESEDATEKCLTEKCCTELKAAF